MTGQPLRLLVVEDHEDDAELLVEHLRREGFEPRWRRVDSARSLMDALGGGEWDLVISDFVMPGFSGREALQVVKETGLDLPFIVISGSVEDEAAVEAMRAGAHDFFRKDRLARLAAAVQRELGEKAVRSERRRVASALRDVEEQHRRMLESIRDYAIFTVDLDGRLGGWNPGVERVLGYREETFGGLPFEKLFTAEDVAAGVPAREVRTAREGNERFDGEGWRIRADGSRFWAEASLTPLRGDEGRTRAFVMVVRDISERKRLIDELRVAVRARDEFLSIASHELRTPLTTLRLQLQSMEPLVAALPPGTPAAPRLASKLAAALRHQGRLAGLVETLLDVSRLQSGKMDLRRERLDVAELVREVAERLEAVRAASGAELKVEAPGPVMGDFDRVRLESVVANLLTNAFKFGQGRPVEVALTHTEDAVSLTVRDFGIGISEENQARIFQRFERAVPESHYGGFGLGLWLVNQVVAAHGGSVGIHSEVGRGTIFRVVLPRRAPG